MTPLKLFLATAAGVYVGLLTFCITMGLLEPWQHQTHRLKLLWQKFCEWLAVIRAIMLEKARGTP